MAYGMRDMGYAFGARICNAMWPARSCTIRWERGGRRRQLESGYSFGFFFVCIFFLFPFSVCCVLGTLTVEFGKMRPNPNPKNENSSLTISDVIDGDVVVVVVVVPHCFT